MSTTKPDDNRVFESGSKRASDYDKPLSNHLLGYTRLRFGYRLRLGANLYGKGNWKLGQPYETIEESIDRHWSQFIDGDRSEDHLAGVMFGINQLMLQDKEAGIPVDKWHVKEVDKPKPEPIEIMHSVFGAIEVSDKPKKDMCNSCYLRSEHCSCNFQPAG